MFPQLHIGFPKQQAWALCASLAVHVALAAWLFHRPAPTFIAPSSVAFGQNGTSVTNVYWLHVHAGRVNSTASHSSGPQPLHWMPPPRKTQAPELASTTTPVADDSPGDVTQARSAGFPLGTLYEGPAIGDEVRPALPFVYPDPVVDRADLAGIAEGDVIIEITIDERGNIVEKIVLRSMGPAIDAKVLAALENWRFRPATRNGVPIPSKQDVYYHFRPS
jgi:TonB family protein